MRIAPAIVVTTEQRDQLQNLVRRRSTQVRLVKRARLVLLAADGWQNKEIADELGMTRRSVGCWRSRFASEGLAGIERERPRTGRAPKRRAAVEAKIIKKTQVPPANATHWTTRTLAKEMGVSQSMVLRVWRANGLKPHLVRTFKLSNDPDFEEKLKDVVGLYLNPPQNALVISVDEKTQVQALDRTQPSLPLVKGRCGTMTHDYKRNGTTTLFAALIIAIGQVIATCMPRHQNGEWIKFLKLINTQTPTGLDLHIILDNYGAHKHANVQRWLKRHPRFHMHYIPTSSSWLNLIERFFRDLTDKRLRRGSFRNVPQLIEAIMSYIKANNEDPKPLVWTANVETILEKVGRARLAMNKIPSE
ncbi:MAG: IS630 family transposase [Planctomycetota bacterium]